MMSSMFRAFFLALLLAAPLASCGDDNTIELPPLAIGSDGARLLGSGESPVQKYQDSYAWFRKAHDDLKRTMNYREPNAYAVKADTRRIIKCLETMQALTEEPTRSAIGEYVEKYRSALRVMETRNSLGSIPDRISRYEGEVTSKFHPSRVKIVAPAEAAAAAVEPEPGTGKALQDEDKLPPPDGEEPPPPVEVARNREVEPDASGTPFWVLYKSWAQVHGELTAAFREGKDCGAHYTRAIYLVGAMAASVKEKDRNTLDLCAKLYQDNHAKTKGFTTLPKGLTQKDILNQLELIASNIRIDYDPDNK